MKTVKVKSFAEAAAIMKGEREQAARDLLAQNREDVRKAANLRKTSHLAKRGTGRGPRVAR